MLSERLKHADFLEKFSPSNWTRPLHWSSDHMTQLWRWLLLSRTTFHPEWTLVFVWIFSCWVEHVDRTFWGNLKFLCFFVFCFLSTASSKICILLFRQSFSHYIRYLYYEFGPDRNSKCSLTGAQAQDSNSGLMYEQTRKEQKGWGWVRGGGLELLLQCCFQYPLLGMWISKGIFFNYLNL